MNNKFLAILIAMITLISMSPVNAALSIGSWTENNDVSLTITNGETAEFTYGVTAVTTLGGKYSVKLYDSNNQVIKTYYNNQPALNNGAVGWITINSVDYGNTVGNYYILIDSTDSFGPSSFRLNLKVDPVVLPTLTASCSATPTSGTTPLNVAFSSTVTGGTGTYTYSWTFGNGQTSTNPQTTTHTYNTAGTYNTQLTVTDSAGNTASANCGQIITVNPTLNLSASCSANPTSGNSPLNVAFNSAVTGGSGVYTYNWTFGDGQTSTNQQTTTHTYTTAGSYDSQLIVTDSLGNSVTRNCGQVVVSQPIPTLTASCSATPTSGTTPLNVAFSSTVTGGTGTYTYSWTFGNGQTSTNPQTTTHTYNTAGTYNTQLTVTDSAGNTASANCGQITPQSPQVPTLRASCSVTPTSGNTPLSTVFSSTVSGGSGAYTYRWTFGDGTSLVSPQTATHIYTSPGTFSTVLTVTDAIGNTATAECGQVTARSQLPALQASCSATPTSGTNPLNVAFSSTVTGGTGTYTYSWTFGDGQTSTNALSSTHTYTTTGSYSSSLTVSDTAGNAVAVNCGQITVNNPAPVNIPVSCSINPTSGYAPLDTTLSAQVTGTGTYTYSWTFGDGLTGVTGPTQNTNAQIDHTYNVGTFYPTVRVTDANGNSGTANCVSNNGLVVQVPTLTINSINCFPRIVSGHNQSCSVSLTSNNGQIPGGVDVDIYYANGLPFGSCVTNALSGACEVEQVVNGVGQYTVYATAQAQGYNSDMDTYPRYTFDVFQERYNIINLATYNDSNFFYPDDTFYRGEPLYVRFQVYDPIGNSFVTSDIVTAASLVSLPGGRADLSRMTYNGNWYYYELDQIPLTHDFLGGSNVFAFAFNFTGLTGGQAQVALTILNNEPVMNNIADIYVNVGASNIIDLDSYGFDLEDNPLRYVISSPTSSGYLASINNVGNLLTVTGLVIGDYTLDISGYDLDNAFDTTTINVHVVQGIVVSNLTATCSVSPISANTPVDATLTSTVSGGTGPYTYSWSFGDQTTSTTTIGTALHTYNNAGTYQTSLIVTDSNGNNAAANCGQVVANTITQPPVNLTVSCMMLPSTGNAPLNVTYLVSVSGGNGLYSYTYDYDDGTTPVSSQLSSSTNTYTLAGTYQPAVSVSDTANGIGSATCGLLVVNNQIPPNVTLIADAGGPYTNYTNTPVVFDASGSISSEGIVSYVWNFGDGTPLVTTTNPTIAHTYTSIGRYTVTLRVIDALGYQDVDTTTALIIEPTNYTPRVFEDLPDKGLSVMNLLVYGRNGEIIEPNDDLTVSMNLKNHWNRRLENVRVIVSIPEYGLEARSSAMDISKGSTKSVSVVLPLEDLDTGVHYVKIYIVNDDDGEQVKRTKYREIIVRD